MLRLRPSLLAWICLGLCPPVVAQGFHQREPNNYLQGTDDNAVTTLNRRLADGAAALPAAGRSRRLGALLRELGVPASSQTVVFSRTSLQRQRISRQNPRALYFGRDVHVGWVPGAPVLEAPLPGC